MKKPILASLFALLPAMLVAEPSVKLELVGPKDVVKISQQELDLAVALSENIKKFERLSQMPDPDLKALRETEQAIEKSKSLKQGIVLKLRFTNTGKAPLEIQYGPDTSKNQVNVEGPGALDLPFNGITTMEYRMPAPITIELGETKEFTIAELSYGARDLSRWLVSKPGDYTVNVTFTTTIKGEKVELTSNQVTFVVKAE